MSPTPKKDDGWTCTGCNSWNESSRTRCRNCQASASKRHSATSAGAASPNDGAVEGATASSMDPGSQFTNSKATAPKAVMPNARPAPNTQPIHSAQPRSACV